MYKILIFLLSFFFIISCKSTKDVFSLKKNNTSDEFLVEKKNPLVMPPDFSDLPTPSNLNETKSASKNDFNKENSLSDNQILIFNQETKSNNKSIETLILEKIE